MEMKVGDYVEILPGVHDGGMPAGRRDGLIVEIPGRDQILIMFSNRSFLKFHKSQVRILQSENR